MKHDTIIISIRPEFVAKILTGKKCYEYRKRFPKGVDKMLIYTTAPIKKITAIAYVEFVLCDTPENIWRETAYCSGVTKEYFDAYFKGKSVAYAIKLKNIRQFNYPLLLSDLDRVKTPPQSFAYFN